MVIVYCEECGSWQRCDELLFVLGGADGIVVQCSACSTQMECSPPVRSFAMDVPSWIWLTLAGAVGAAAGTWLTYWAIG